MRGDARVPERTHPFIIINPPRLFRLALLALLLLIVDLISRPSIREGSETVALSSSRFAGRWAIPLAASIKAEGGAGMRC